ncbi:hypothetical protein HKX48_000432 [Thoreauomyces humboldtii]|nr:hypothetical protein HKX48_000432 [Thoreauomyces humboldtii]
MVGDDSASPASLTAKGHGAGAGIALLLVDVINDIAFEGNEYMLDEAKKMAPKIKKMAGQCRDIGIPVIYCNDNFGKWRSSLEQIYEAVTGKDSPGKEVAEMLRPTPEDFFVLKPKHSAFYATALETLLAYLQVKTVIIVGMAGNVCVLFSANDAYMRDFATFVPRDCIASSSEAESEAALLLMDKVLGSSTRPSTELDLKNLLELHEKSGLSDKQDIKKRQGGNQELSRADGGDAKRRKKTTGTSEDMASDPPSPVG